MCEDNMLFSHVKADLVSHWCLYNKMLLIAHKHFTSVLCTFVVSSFYLLSIHFMHCNLFAIVNKAIKNVVLFPNNYSGRRSIKLRHEYCGRVSLAMYVKI